MANTFRVGYPEKAKRRLGNRCPGPKTKVPRQQRIHGCASPGCDYCLNKPERRAAEDKLLDKELVADLDVEAQDRHADACCTFDFWEEEEFKREHYGVVSRDHCPYS